VLELFKEKGQLTSRELALVVGKTSGGDALTRCRQVGIPIRVVGLAPGSDREKLYALDPAELWSALEESVRQQSRYARLLNMQDQGARLSFPSAAAWIVHYRKIVRMGPIDRGLKHRSPPPSR
jgi:hypothetical protein